MKTKLSLRLILTICFVMDLFLGFTQNQSIIKLSTISFCSYYGEKNTSSVIYGFASDQEARNTINNIIKYTGLPANFKIVAANVSNAAAVIECNSNNNCERYILYNQEFILRVKNTTKNDWSAISIIQ